MPAIATRIGETDRGRREQLRPALQDPKVVDEVYRGVSPGEFGMDTDGRPLQSNGIVVKNDLEWAAEALDGNVSRF